MKPELERAIHALTTLNQIGFEKPEHLNLLCQCMSPVGTAIKRGQISSPEDLKKLLAGMPKKVEVPQVPKQYLRNLFVDKKITLPATSGKRTIKSATTLYKGGYYPYCDGFDGLPDEAISTEETEVTIYELVLNGRFTEFLPVERYLKSEDQVNVFCETHRDLLGKNHSTLIPFLKGGKVFVASVCIYDNDGLRVRVYGLGRSDVWGTEGPLRVVLPPAL